MHFPDFVVMAQHDSEGKHQYFTLICLSGFHCLIFFSQHHSMYLASAFVAACVGGDKSSKPRLSRGRGMKNRCGKSTR